MNKKQWDKSCEVRQMLLFSKPSVRKQKLFVVHCLDHNKQYFSYSESEKALKLFYLYADGKITTSKLERQIEKLRHREHIIVAYMLIGRNHFNIHYAANLSSRAAYLRYHTASSDYDSDIRQEFWWQCKLLREMVRPNFEGE